MHATHRCVITGAELLYRGIVVGWDLECCESEEWMATNKVDGLERKSKQPFYHVSAMAHSSRVT